MTETECEKYDKETGKCTEVNSPDACYYMVGGEGEGDERFGGQCKRHKMRL